MNRAILITLFLFIGILVYPQKIKNVSATYTYYAPETMSVEEAKRTALERAKIQAIADVFGTIVSQSTSAIVSNKNGESDTQFFSIGGSDVKGEWIETIGEPDYKIQFENHFLVVNCSVKGKARAIESAQIEFVAKPLRNGNSLKYESTEFKDGDDLYLYFKSPVDGYLAIYLLEELTQTVYSILPYKSENISAAQIEGGKEYIFFSVKDTNRENRGVVDEYSLYSTVAKEYNTMYLLFSPSRIGRTSGFSTGIEDKPNNIKYVDFRKWLSKELSRNRLLQVSELVLTISK